MRKMNELSVSPIGRRAKKGILSKRKSKEISTGEREHPKFLAVIPDELCEFMRDKKNLTWEDILERFRKHGFEPGLSTTTINGNTYRTRVGGLLFKDLRDGTETKILKDGKIYKLGCPGDWLRVR
jgi:hypothetical protein